MSNIRNFINNDITCNFQGDLKNQKNYYDYIDLISNLCFLSKIKEEHQKDFDFSSQTINPKYLIPAPNKYDYRDKPQTLVLGYKYPDDCKVFDLAGGQFEVNTLSDNVIRRYDSDDNIDFVRKTLTADLFEYSDEVFDRKKDLYKQTYKNNLADSIKQRDVSFIKRNLEQPKTSEEFYSDKKLKQFQSIEKLVSKMCSNFGDRVYDITKISLPSENESNDTELLEFLKDRTFLMLGSNYPDNSFYSSVSMPCEIKIENNRRDLYSIFDSSPNQEYVFRSEDRNEYEVIFDKISEKIEEYRSLILSRSFIKREIFTEKISKKNLRPVESGVESIHKIFI